MAGVNCSLKIKIKTNVTYTTDMNVLSSFGNKL